MCLDITYLSVLLEHGFGLNSQTKLKVRFEKDNLHKRVHSTISLFDLHERHK